MNKQVKEILEQYALENAECTVLRHLGNLVVRVEADARRYALRVCEPQVSAAQLQTELDGLQALKRDTDLYVPTPVTSVQGDLVTASIIFSTSR
ncbi:hypothetical protein [Gloeobacter violaceus]|uniref:Gsl3203 protein n=1 Tax=Gloeobacter violaceus (strain ATCC 29082 / PCC 7421) TaxID=251221 RepID=Q7NGG6_GLOVI|nr:hypothetical protein [Gloeobacter violaceus]BAC91144.1 gsl3203 [Gloeobacter violaceus PCC 7421]